MTLKRSIVFIRIIPVAVLLLVSAGCLHMLPFFSSDKGWMLFDVSRLRDYYYNPGNIERLSKTLAKVRIAIVIRSEEGRNWEVDERMKRGLPFGGYENYHSSEDVYIMDCEDREYQLLSSTDYDKEGKELATYKRPYPKWESVPSGSALDTLLTFKSVCP